MSRWRKGADYSSKQHTKKIKQEGNGTPKKNGSKEKENTRMLECGMTVIIKSSPIQGVWESQDV